VVLVVLVVLRVVLVVLVVLGVVLVVLVVLRVVLVVLVVLEVFWEVFVFWCPRKVSSTLFGVLGPAEWVLAFRNRGEYFWCLWSFGAPGVRGARPAGVLSEFLREPLRFCWGSASPPPWSSASCRDSTGISPRSAEPV